MLKSLQYTDSSLYDICLIVVILLRKPNCVNIILFKNIALLILSWTGYLDDCFSFEGESDVNLNCIISFKVTLHFKCLMPSVWWLIIMKD